MPKGVEHKAFITAVNAGSVTVAVSSGGQCGGCGIALVCASKGERIVMDVPVRGACRYEVGQPVTIVASRRSEWVALWLGMALPCALLLCSVIGLLWAGVGSTPSAISGVVVIAVYYLILYIFRKKVAGSIKWSIADDNG